MSKEGDPSSPGPQRGISDEAWAYHQAKAQWQEADHHNYGLEEELAWEILMDRRNEYLGENRQKGEPTKRASGVLIGMNFPWDSV
jgi:hypothetical protein